MLKDITIGQYIPGESIIHKLDPRTKLIIAFIYIINLFRNGGLNLKNFKCCFTGYRPSKMPFCLDKNTKEYKDFEKPAGIITAKVCKKSGKLAVNGVCDCDPRGNMITTEYFAKGTVPTDYCDTHVKVTICSESDMPAGEYCPDNNKTGKIFILRPSGSSGTTADSAYSITEDELEKTCTYHSQEWHNENNNANDNPVNNDSPENTQATQTPEDGAGNANPQQPTDGTTVPPATDTTNNPADETAPGDGSANDVTNNIGGF